MAISRIRTMGWTATVLVVALLFLGNAKAQTHAWDDEFEEAPTVRGLDDRSFEHETQAATGQTTGSWLVLFTSSGCVTCGDVESTLLRVIPKLNGGLPIIAKVNISASPSTAKRFDVQKIPQLKLFRDRSMFSYGGQLSEASILSFIEDGWKGFDREVVPKELTFLDELQDKFWTFYRALIKYLANRPGILAGVGSMSAMAAYLFTKQFIIKKHTHRRPRGRPRKRAE
ncbi:unnamed protein product [Calypogeia fissa]